MGANAAFPEEIREIVLIVDKQNSLQDLLSLCLPDHLQEAERGEPKPSHEEVSTSHHVVLVWFLWGRNCHPLFSRGGGGGDGPGTDLLDIGPQGLDIGPQGLDRAGSDAQQGTGQCPTCSWHLNEILQSQNAVGSKGL